MKRFLNILLLLLLPIFTGLKCEKEPLNIPHKPTLPPITTEGKNTFGCLVDGKLFLPKEPSWMKTAYIKEYYDSRSSDLKGSLKIGSVQLIKELNLR